MGTVNIPNRPAGGDARSIATILADFDAITTVINGNLDATNLAAQAVTKEKLDQTGITVPLGLNDGTGVRRGKSIIAATETRANAAYGLMTTPDRVQNLILPQDGLFFVAYQATWQESVNGAANVALFIGANQAKLATTASSGPVVPPTTSANAGAANIDVPLALLNNGFGSAQGSNAGAYPGDVTTGQELGLNILTGVPFVGVFAAAGTYDVSVQFKASSGSVTVKNRKLWVWTMGF